MYQPNYLTDREEMSFSPFDRRFTCAHSGYQFQEDEMTYIDFFAEWVSNNHLDEYLLEVKENVLPSEYELIIKQIKPYTK